MIYYAVIDTNVIVSALLKPDSIPGNVVNLITIDKIVPIYNNKIEQEYKNVLARNKFNFPKEKQEDFFELLKFKGIKSDFKHTDEVFVDETDVVFYEVTLCFLCKTNNAYLITGNIKHFPKKTFVVSPKEMIEIIKNNDNH